MHTPVGLKDICPERIPHPQCHIIVTARHGSGCPHSKGKEAETLWKWNRLDGMKMNALDFVLPLLRIDVNLKILLGHSSAQIDHVSFGPALPSREIQNRCGKP
jgi:hypothetical protein